ncbi:hypothetical protein LTR56_005962 [Elasticomyces elasticus]|nr:hypothetical protein LTR56_005962 [Elasticomyces elasticus]KAK3669078.1 hypothetical protein LTR22_000157 [Elasticomyces elasticus]KAK4920959.1 hypothetical protein LTR49_011503 [Elasticomyces elasticus]KAK5759536.1 hypothetical protein LTS12_010394 [Elasticomyces elasticus]
MQSQETVFTNVRLCINGQLVSGKALTVSDGIITSIEDASTVDNHEAIDLAGAILSPGFLELQTNGLRGFHFTHFDNETTYSKKLEEVARYLPQTGVTGFYPTIPTVHSDEFKRILPSLAPRDITNGATVLGAHAEGPYLHPSKKGAHNASLFQQPSTPPTEIYGEVATSNSVLKIVTLAPELEGTPPLIHSLTAKGIRVSLGHSSATYPQGLAAVKAGATCLTHTLNAMAPLHHRDPGLAGLVTAPSSPPYFSIIADGNHLHPSIATLLFRSNPSKCILTTDSIELAGLPDGTYPGHSQIPFNQTKIGSKVVIEGTETLIGGCAGLDECVRNLVGWSGCSVAEAVSCVTENVAGLMGEEGRRKLVVGGRADLVVLGDGGEVRGTWVGGRKVWSKT